MTWRAVLVLVLLLLPAWALYKTGRAVWASELQRRAATCALEASRVLLIEPGDARLLCRMLAGL
jgi:hypothetical protein